MGYPERCRAVHTANPSFAEPARKRGVKAYLKWKVAKMTKGKVQALSFGYLPGEVAAAKRQGGSSKTEESIYSDRPLALTQTLHRLYSMRPQTLSFSLCDSPVGLLAALLDVIHTRTPAGEEMGSRSMSPFLSPVEMEMEMERQEGVRHEESVPERNVGDMGQADRNYVWSPTEVLNWVMMQWLPGEFALHMLSVLQWLAVSWCERCPALGKIRRGLVLTFSRSRVVPSMAAAGLSRYHSPSPGRLLRRTSGYQYLPLPSQQRVHTTDVGLQLMADGMGRYHCTIYHQVAC
jgi:hypothetical protein